MLKTRFGSMEGLAALSGSGGVAVAAVPMDRGHWQFWRVRGDFVCGARPIAIVRESTRQGFRQRMTPSRFPTARRWFYVYRACWTGLGGAIPTASIPM